MGGGGAEQGYVCGATVGAGLLQGLACGKGGKGQARGAVLCEGRQGLNAPPASSPRPPAPLPPPAPRDPETLAACEPQRGHQLALAFPGTTTPGMQIHAVARNGKCHSHRVTCNAATGWCTESWYPPACPPAPRPSTQGTSSRPGPAATRSRGGVCRWGCAWQDERQACNSPAHARTTRDGLHFCSRCSSEESGRAVPCRLPLRSTTLVYPRGGPPHCRSCRPIGMQDADVSSPPPGLQAS